MADDKDVLGKADALLRRHSVAPPRDGSETGGVPVLTDLVEAPPEAGAGPTDDPLTREVVDRVMAEVERRLGRNLERRLLEHLAAEVHAAVASAIGDLRGELANMIGDAIAEARERGRVK